MRTKEQKNASGKRGHFWAPQSAQDEHWDLQSLILTQARWWPCTKFVKLCNLLNRRLLKKNYLFYIQNYHLGPKWGTASQPPSAMAGCTEMSALVLKAKSRWIIVGFFPEKENSENSVLETSQRSHREKKISFWVCQTKRLFRCAQATYVRLGKGKLVHIQVAGFSKHFKLSGFVCFALNHLERQDKSLWSFASQYISTLVWKYRWLEGR